MKLYLHIGIPRTASTFLQTKIFSRLSHLHFIGPPFQKEDHEVFLIMEAFVKLIYGLGFDAQDRTLLEKIAISPKSTLVSNEGLSMNPWTQNYPTHANRLKEFFQEIKVILFLRHPTDWVLSLYGLAIQKGRFVSLRDFVGFDGKSFCNFADSSDHKSRVHLQNIRFSQLLRNWRQTFPNTRVFFFEDFVTQKEELINEVLKTLNSNLVPTKLRLDRKANASAPLFVQDTAAGIFNTLYRNNLQADFFQSVRYRLADYSARIALNQGITLSAFSQQEDRLELQERLDKFFVEEIENIKTLVPNCPWR